MTNKTITIQSIVNAHIEKVWHAWNEPEEISKWAFASDDWEAVGIENNLKAGGQFKTIMRAKDLSSSFDFTGTYTEVIPNELIEYSMDDGRRVKIEFAQTPEGVKITQTFDMENENTEELQRSGWQSILDNFKKYAESK